MGAVRHDCVSCGTPWVIGRCSECNVQWQVWRGAEKATCGACGHINAVPRIDVAAQEITLRGYAAGATVAPPHPIEPEPLEQPVMRCVRCRATPAYHRIGADWYCGSCSKKRQKKRVRRNNTIVAGSVVAILVGGALGIALGVLTSRGGSPKPPETLVLDNRVAVVPDVVGMSASAATSSLGERGFETIRIVRKSRARSGERVVRQRPAGGLRATTDLPITLVVERR